MFCPALPISASPAPRWFVIIPSWPHPRSTCVRKSSARWRGWTCAPASSSRASWPACTTDAAGALHQLAAMVRGKSLVMVFSDLLCDPEPVLAALHHLRHRGHEVILFHVMDEAEVHFPFSGLVEFEDVETPDRLTL